MKLSGLNQTEEDKNTPIPIEFVSLVKGKKKKKGSTRKRAPKEQPHVFKDSDLVKGMFNSNSVKLNEAINKGHIIVIKGVSTSDYIQAMRLSKSHLEIFFEIYNELGKHIAYGVQIR